MVDLAGLYPPIPTPFNDSESLALPQLEHNLTIWCSQPLDGVVMPGSNSEAAYLTRGERIELWKVCAGILRSTQKRFIAGAGAETTAETIALTETAAQLGAAAVLLIPPYFYKPAMTHDALVVHYRSVADQSPVPVLLYNVPAYTGVDFGLPTLLDLSQHPNIVGIKDSSSNIVRMAELMAERPAFQVFAGTGSALLPFLSLGAAGGIMALANVAAPQLHGLLLAFRQGRLDEARRIQLALAGLNSAITTRFGVPGLKYAMERVGMYGGPARRPLLPLTVQARSEIDELVVKLSAES